MTTIGRARLSWDGFPGSPGVSTFYATDILSLLPALSTLMNAIKFSLPTDVTITFPAAGDELDSATGALVGTWSATAQTPVTGTGSGTYSAPVGWAVNWKTNTVVGRRRLQGRTFFVPAAGSMQGAQGQVNPSDLAALDSAVSTFVTSAISAGMQIWHRPKHGTGGQVAILATGAVQRKMVVLRSRRD